MAPDELFTREEVLRGLPGRRAGALLLQIEAAAARAAEHRRRVTALMGTSRAAPAPPPDEDAAENWFPALGRGRNALPRPTIRQIERYARVWSYLVPENPRLRAALVRRIGQKYRFTRAAVPRLRAALGLDAEAVRRAYEELYAQPLESLFAPHVGLAERFRWFVAALTQRLEDLPLFWLTAAYLLMGNFPSTVLILPIVVASVGPNVGMALVCFVGGLNILTIGCMAEAAARSGDIEYRNAFLGRLTASYLGGAGAGLLYYNFIAQGFLAVLAGQVGIALTLSHVVGLPPAVWALLWAAFLIYRLWRTEQSGKVAGDMLLGGACIGATVLLSLVALAHARPGFLHGGAGAGGQLDLSLLGALGGILMCYYGHSTIPFCAKLVLPRDPSGQELLRGSIAGTVGAIALQLLFVFAISAAVPPALLQGESQTALGPLGDTLGPAVMAAGLVTACLFIGLDGTGASDVLYGLIRERIPTFSHSMAVLRRRQGRLLLHRRDALGDGPHLGLTYLGLAGGQPRFRVDVQSGLSVRRSEFTLAERWEIEALFDAFPELREQSWRLALELVEADADAARLLIATSLEIETEGGREAAGLSVVESLDLSAEEVGLLRWLMIRGETSVADAAADGQGDEKTVRALLAALEERRMIRRVERNGAERFRPRWTRRRRSRLPEAIWRSLEAPDATEPAAPAPTRRKQRRVGVNASHFAAVRERAREAAMSEAGRFALGASPMIVATPIALRLLFSGEASFVAILEVGGILTNVLASGIFPLLLLASCRRKGMFLATRQWGFLGHPVVLAALYLFFLGVLIVHGLIGWHGIPGSASALLVAGLVLAATVVMARRGAFASALVVELREDLRPDASSLFRVVADGRPTAAQVRLIWADGERDLEAASGEIPAFFTLRSAEFRLPATGARELRVWVHRVTPEGDSEAVPARMEMHDNGEIRRFDLGLLGGQAHVPFDGKTCRVQVTLPDPSEEGEKE